MIGLDLLGLGHRLWKITDTVKALQPGGIPIGVFDTVFGDARPALLELLSKVPVPAVRVHLQYTKGHEIIPLDIVKARAPLYEKLARRFASTKFYISHTCEHNEKSLAEVRKRIALIKKLAPSCTPVNSVWKGVQVPGMINEDHSTGSGHFKQPFIASTDGTDICNIDATKYKKNKALAELMFLHAPRFNLREQYEEESDCPAPLDRTAIPSFEYMKAIIAIIADEGRPPASSLKAIPFKKPFLYKSFAEDKAGEADQRANRPLIITYSKAKTMNVLCWDGTKIGEFFYFGPYLNGTYRHYSSMGYGWEIGRKALKQSGSVYVWFSDSKTIYGPVNPAFRRGFFQGA